MPPYEHNGGPQLTSTRRRLRRKSIIPANVIPVFYERAENSKRSLPPDFSEWFICRLITLVGFATVNPGNGELVRTRGIFQGLVNHLAFIVICTSLRKSLIFTGGCSFTYQAGMLAVYGNGIAKAWSFWWGWDVPSFNDIFRGLNSSELFVCKAINVIWLVLHIFMLGPFQALSFLPLLLIENTTKEALGNQLIFSTLWTSLLYLCIAVVVTFQMAATGSFIMACAMISMKTRRFVVRVEKASEYFLKRWDKLHRGFSSNIGAVPFSKLQTEEITAMFEKVGRPEENDEDEDDYSDREAHRLEAELLAQQASTRDVEVDDLANKIGHSLINENSVLFKYAAKLSSSYEVYFLGAEFLMVIGLIIFGLALKEGKKGTYTGEDSDALMGDFCYCYGFTVTLILTSLITVVIGMPLSVSHHGCKVIEAFRRRPCSVWAAVGDHLSQEVIGFSTMGHIIGPAIFLVGGYALLSYSAWMWVEREMQAPGIILRSLEENLRIGLGIPTSTALA